MTGAGDEKVNKHGGVSFDQEDGARKLISLSKTRRSQPSAGSKLMNNMDNSSRKVSAKDYGPWSILKALSGDKWERGILTVERHKRDVNKDQNASSVLSSSVAAKYKLFVVSCF